VTATAEQIDATLSALSDSHDRLAAAAAKAGGDGVTGPSYCTDWSIAQVLSHLGSGAEIFGLNVEAGLHGRPAPGQEQYQHVWDVWNAKSPEDQARDGVAEDAALVEQLAGLTEEQRLAWRLDLFGTERDLNNALLLRLSEHIMHTWDVEVMVNQQAMLPGDASGLALDFLPELVAYVGKPTGEELTVHVTTEHPERYFELAVGPESVVLAKTGPEPDPGVARLRLPAEAFARLLTGRLDPEHTPAVQAQGVDLDQLRAVFPGF
jgi:uncharacterized protein (TIGR03083 family)